MIEEPVQQDENLRLAGLRFRAVAGDAAAAAELKSAIVARMALPLYQAVALQLDWPKDAELVTRLSSEIEKRLAELDTKLQEARDSAGESEVREALLARADFFASIFDRTRAEEAYAETTKRRWALDKRSISFSL